jgi:hypothetical protein
VRQATVRYDWFLPAEVARYDAALAHGKPTRLDDATWSDLELDRYLDHLAAHCSIFGRQMLVPPAAPAAAARRSARRMQPSGKPQRRPWRACTRWTPKWQACSLRATYRAACLDTLVGSVGLEPTGRHRPMGRGWRGAGWGGRGGGAGAFGTRADRPAWADGAVAPPARGLLALLDAALALKPLQHPRWQAEADALHGDVQRLRAALGPSWVEQVPAVADYANLLALYQYRRFGRELVQLRDERPSLQRCLPACCRRRSRSGCGCTCATRP